MSIVIGLHQGDYVLIAADTRTVWIDDEIVVMQDDNSLKVHQTGIGLISGSGDCQLLERVRRRLAATDVRHTNELVAVINEERERFKEEAVYQKSYIEKSLNTTGWLFSYEAPQDNGEQLRLALVHPSLDLNKLALISPGSCKIVFPTDHSDESLEQLLKKEIKPIENADHFRETISSQCAAIRNVIENVSTGSKYVSPSCTIGIHILGGEKFITSDCKPDTQKTQNDFDDF